MYLKKSSFFFNQHCIDGKSLVCISIHFVVVFVVGEANVILEMLSFDDHSFSEKFRLLVVRSSVTYFKSL